MQVLRLVSSYQHFKEKGRKTFLTAPFHKI